jgi:AraC family transcriptional regulator
VERVIAHVQRAWSGGRATAIGLDELARAAHVSRGHLVRLFQRELGVTPARALRMLRLDRAAQLVAQTNFRLKEIAEMTGFATAFHFSRAFRELYQRSPRAFRAYMMAGGDMPTLPLLRVRSFAGRVWRPAKRVQR